MKRQIKKWTLRLVATVLLIAGLLLIIVLNPILTYANKTTHKNYSVYHNKTLDPALITSLDEATEFLKTSELYNPALNLDICLNDGSKYPKLMRILRGQAFAWGFYNKVVLQGNANFIKNHVELNGYKWNLTQLLAHEMTHCLQFDMLGFWKSNPVANIPDWKWEGYAEYVSRQNMDQKDLKKNIERFITTDKNSWEIHFTDSTIAPREYYDSWTLVQYCLDIKKMNYKQLLADTVSEQQMRQEMMNWFSRRE
jgi:Collagenase